MFDGAHIDPVRNRRLFKFGIVASLAVLPWAALFGGLRGIPVWWRFLDASFGALAFIPAWLCHRRTGRLESERTLAAG